MPARLGDPPAPRAWWRRRTLLPRLLLAVAAVLLLPASAFAQASPWENAVDVLRAGLHGPDRARPESGRDRRRRPGVRLRRGAEQTPDRRHRLRRRHGHRRRQLHGVAVSRRESGAMASELLVPRGLHVDQSAAHHLGRRPSAVPPGADARRRGLQLLRQPGGRAARVPARSTSRRAGSRRRTRSCCGSCSTPGRLRTEYDPLDARPRCPSGGAAVLARNQLLRRYRQTGAMNGSAEPLRVPRRPGVPDQERGRRRRAGASTGVDYEGLEPAQRDAVARRFESALRLLDDRFRLLQYLIKQRGPADPGRVPPGSRSSTRPSAHRQAFLEARRPISTTSTSSSSCSTKGPAGGGAWCDRRHRGSCATRGPRWPTGCPRPAR